MNGVAWPQMSFVIRAKSFAMAIGYIESSAIGNCGGNISLPELTAKLDLGSTWYWHDVWRGLADAECGLSCLSVYTFVVLAELTAVCYVQ